MLAAGLVTADKVSAEDVFTMNLQSGNYSPGSSGFKIDAINGTAEFYNISLRISNPATVRSDLNVADGADVTGLNTAYDTSRVNGTWASTVKQYAINGNTAKGYTDAWKYGSTTYINGGRIYTNTITASQIAANTITANQIAAGAITASEVGANQIIASSANIKDAVVTTLKIGEDQVTVPRAYWNASGLDGNNDWRTVASITVSSGAFDTDSSAEMPFFFVFSCRLGYGNTATVSYRVLKNEGLLRDYGSTEAYNDFPTIAFTNELKPNETFTFAVQLSMPSHVNASKRSMFAIGAKR
jgi:hypothetical protein